MATHKIIVEVNDKTPQSPTQPNEAQQPTEVAPTQKVASGRMTALDGLVGAAAFNMGKNMILGSIARIGSATGDYYAQKKLNNAMALGNYAFAIGTMGAAGLLYTAMDIGFKAYDYNLEKAKADINTDLYRQSVGLAAVSGSRYKGRKI